MTTDADRLREIAHDVDQGALESWGPRLRTIAERMDKLEKIEAAANDPGLIAAMRSAAWIAEDSGDPAGRKHGKVLRHFLAALEASS